MNHKKVIICGVVKNAGQYLEKSLNICIKTGEMFADYKIVIYENNSTDDTKNILNKYNNHHHFTIMTEDISYTDIKNTSKIWSYKIVTGSDHPCRIEQICNARNKVIKKIRSPEYDTYDYVIWIDLDTHFFSLQDIQDSFEKTDWDVLYANGMDYNGNYYDKYAYRDIENIPFGPEIIGDKFWSTYSHKNITINNDLEQVISAYGGMGIFKKEIFNDLEYCCLVNDDIKNYYTDYLKKQDISSEYLSLIENPCSKFPDGYIQNYLDFHGNSKNIFWKFNSGYDNCIVCEHVALNIAIINKGYKIFIHKKLKYFWT